jgi:F420H(2)-dependent quinone reductase
MHDSLVKILSRAHAGLFLISGGRLGTRLVNNDMLLLTTTGRTTGRSHTVPLLYLTDDRDYVVIASYGGRQDHPEWYRNLTVEPSARVQVGSTQQHIFAETMSSAERDVWWPKIVDAYSDYAVYQSRTDRIIPVVRLNADPR